MSDWGQVIEGWSDWEVGWAQVLLMCVSAFVLLLVLKPDGDE